MELVGFVLAVLGWILATCFGCLWLRDRSDRKATEGADELLREKAACLIRRNREGSNP